MHTLITPSPVTVPALPGVTEEEFAFVDGLKVAKEERVRFAVRRLLSLRDTGRHVYRNTVSRKEIARRRRANALAKASRKANR